MRKLSLKLWTLLQKFTLEFAEKKEVNETNFVSLMAENTEVLQYQQTVMFYGRTTTARMPKNFINLLQCYFCFH